MERRYKEMQKKSLTRNHSLITCALAFVIYNKYVRLIFFQSVLRQSWEPLTRIEWPRGGPVQVTEEASRSERSYLPWAYENERGPSSLVSTLGVTHASRAQDDISPRREHRNEQNIISMQEQAKSGLTGRKRRCDVDRYSFKWHTSEDQDRNADFGCRLSHNFTRACQSLSKMILKD